LPLVEGLLGLVRKTFVFALGDPTSRFAEHAKVCQPDPEWEYHELPGHRFLMMSHPAEVTKILLCAEPTEA